MEIKVEYLQKSTRFRFIYTRTCISLKTLFSVFGRRLGTTDDGTSLRVSHKLELRSYRLIKTTRDLTLKEYNVVIGSRRTDRGEMFGKINQSCKYLSLLPTTFSEETAKLPTMRPIRTLEFESGVYPIEQFKNVKINEISTRSFSRDADLFLIVVM